MALITASLNVPGSGAGNSTTISSMDIQKTIQCTTGGIIDIQISNDGVTWVNIYRFKVAGSTVMNFFAKFIRTNVIEVDQSKTVAVNITANTILTPLLTSSATVPTTGNGSGIDVTNMGLTKTIYCTGSSEESVDIQFSHDGTTYSHEFKLGAGQFLTLDAHCSKIRGVALKADFRTTASIFIAGASQSAASTLSARPSASAVGAGFFYFATDASPPKPLWSDGNSWRDAAGNIVA